MAIAPTPITSGKSLLELLQKVAPPQERAVELYRRLLAINDLSDSMNIASDINDLQKAMAVHFQEYFPDDFIWLYLRDGVHIKRLHLSGPKRPEGDIHPPETGIAASAMKALTPLWIPDVLMSQKMRKSSNAAPGLLARSMLIIPFSVMGKAVGCLEMRSNHPNRFDEIEYHLASLIASHLSSSLENVVTRQELALANARLKDHDLRLTQLNERLQQLAHTDESTGLFNKRRLLEQLQMEVARARRYGEIFCCLMIDIDDFKPINDNHGHQAGDEVLRQTGMLLRRSLRVTDFVARFGGEEFTVILPRTNSAGAYRVAENLRSAFMSHAFALPNANLHITISLGVACCTTFDHLDAQQIILRADSALYRAKRSGKNQTCFADESDPLYGASEFCQAYKPALTQ
jgi:diguanylate cyclase (GGDEF)-like protein